MDNLENLEMPVTIGLIGIVIIYFAFSKYIEQYHDSAMEQDPFGCFIVTGWLFLGFHKLFQVIFPNNHLLALRIFMILFGVFLLGMSVLLYSLISK